MEAEEWDILTRLRAGERLHNFVTQRRHKSGRFISVSLTISPVRDERGIIIGASEIARDLTEQQAAQATQAALIDKLQKALAEIHTLQALLPICMHCKKIRDDHGFWQQLERYLNRHASLNFSHSICPDCLREHWPDQAEATLRSMEIRMQPPTPPPPRL